MQVNHEIRDDEWQLILTGDTAQCPDCGGEYVRDTPTVWTCTGCLGSESLLADCDILLEHDERWYEGDGCLILVTIETGRDDD